MNTTTTDTTPTLDSNEANRVEIIIPDGRVTNWRVLVNWFLAIPHLIMVHLLAFVGVFVWLFLGLAVLFAGRVPDFCYRYLLGWVRYHNQAWGYVWYFSKGYPKFRVMLDDPVDTSDYQIRTHFYPNPGKVPRWRFFWPVLAIPHFVLLWVLQYVCGILVLVGALVGLLTGRYPEWLRIGVASLGDLST